jgi:arabinose-5-phosphate isomerase
MSISFYYQIHIDTIKKSLESLDVAQAYKIVDDLLECKGKIFFTGIGKNGHVAAKATSTFSSIGLPCFFIDAVDSVHGDMGVVNEDDILIAISKSGNTEELIHFLEHVQHKNCKIISIHSNPGNRSLDYSYLDINLQVEKEADHLNIVPTCSIAIFTVFLQSVACEISKCKELTLEQFVKNHPGGSIGKTKI